MIEEKPAPEPTPVDPDDKKEDKKEDKKDDSKKDDSKKDDNKSDKKEEKKYSNEWINGKWYNFDGTQTYTGTLQWKSDANGWWVEDETGWYAKNQWQKIDGKWYFFCADGYMDYSEYIDGCWLGQTEPGTKLTQAVTGYRTAQAGGMRMLQAGIHRISGSG